MSLALDRVLDGVFREFFTDVDRLILVRRRVGFEVGDVALLVYFLNIFAANSEGAPFALGHARLEMIDIDFVGAWRWVAIRVRSHYANKRD